MKISPSSFSFEILSGNPSGIMYFNFNHCYHIYIYICINFISSNFKNFNTSRLKQFLSKHDLSSIYLAFYQNKIHPDWYLQISVPSTSCFVKTKHYRSIVNNYLLTLEQYNRIYTHFSVLLANNGCYKIRVLPLSVPWLSYTLHFPSRDGSFVPAATAGLVSAPVSDHR